MTIHPIRVLDHVIEEYRDYLLTEFRARDPRLKEALERELDRPGFLAQEPFYQAHRPFKDGKPWGDLPIDSRLARVMEERTHREHCYIHQSETISHLLAPRASPVVVTTGTGSGKTECFLLPVIQNAIEDAVRFRRAGLTAILLYPMNALANDQLQRIEDYLDASGFAGAIQVAKYDRGTTQAQREALRRNPPHILLTNYMMLEYLLVRPSDREAIFANHRCRFLVLDEVHTYRGVLGSNVALLVRRLKAHLARAQQDWNPNPSDQDRERRYPKLIPIGTSATIRSLDEEGLSPEEARQARDQAVQSFFSSLTGVEGDTVKVLGEELQDIQIPDDARYSGQVSLNGNVDLADSNFVRHALCNLSGIDDSTPLEEASRRCRILWDLNRFLIRKPMSINQLVSTLMQEVPERSDQPIEQVRREVQLALNVGAALPENTPGALQLRVHRFIRGGWQFHRCIDPACGKLYPMGEESCECGHVTARLYLCRDCGADYLRLEGDAEAQQLRAASGVLEGKEWMVYERARFEVQPWNDEEEGDEEEDYFEMLRRPQRARLPRQLRRRPVLEGSFDVNTLTFSPNEDDFPLRVVLSPARTRCLSCGGTAGSRNVITPVALGTSAAVKVLAEGLLDGLSTEPHEAGDDFGKDRLLVFSDSRQDAAHQARFIIFASRYDRMRRRVVKLLEREGPLSIQRLVELLGDLGVAEGDNPHAPSGASAWVPTDQQSRIRAWEEAPLLDELAVNAGYRATLVNLGLVGVVYDRLDEYVKTMGDDLVQRLGIDMERLTYLSARILDDIRTRGALSREMLRYNPFSTRCPDYIRSAEWERRIKSPQGFPVDKSGETIAYLESQGVPNGIRLHNAWRRPRAGGRGPRLQRTFEHLLNALGGSESHEELQVDLLNFLRQGNFLQLAELHGARERFSLLQVNAETVMLELARERTRCRCGVCGMVVSPARTRFPCPRCHGYLVSFTDAQTEESRYVRRIKQADLATLAAAEHTAQVPHDEREEIENEFKGTSEHGRLNLLACSPTLEMGIDVGGLDAIVMRNIPPRPDNYAQRGGRAGRRSRVGLVVGYARSTPHDQYFYDKPEEMIAGEVPAPTFALGNRDVITRHLNAIVFGASEPGAAGKMVEYVGPMGDLVDESVSAFMDGVRGARSIAIDLALEAWGDDVLDEAGIGRDTLEGELESLPDRINDVFLRTSRQVKELRGALDAYYRNLSDPRSGQRAGEIVARLLGISSGRRGTQDEADDRSAGYPLRRFAEFGILPGYEFPTEPAAFRLLGDAHEEEPVTTSRRLGIAQFQPGARVFARSRRWLSIGLDMSSPWNPMGGASGWPYRVCNRCSLRFDADEPRCPRCGNDSPGRPVMGMEYAGFLGRRDESPILDEEERYAMRNLVSIYAQWNGDVTGRWSVPGGWGLRLSRGETVLWLNEGEPTTPRDQGNEASVLHQDNKGYLLCGSCGHVLQPDNQDGNSGGSRRQTRRSGSRNDPYGHAPQCPEAGTPPRPVAIYTQGRGEILRLLAVLPQDAQDGDVLTWGMSLGYALRLGMIRYFALSDVDIDFQFEGMWTARTEHARYRQVSLAFIDPSLGGSGYLSRIAERFQSIAQEALEHLDHGDCESACYRCLKAYQNQRHHDFLHWPRIVGDLEALSVESPQGRPPQTGDIEDPRPWLEAYAEGVGSPLELRFWRLFQDSGITLEKQVPVSPGEGMTPISVADFANPEKRIAIYVDGAAFHSGANLRRDVFLRNQLRDGSHPWRVFELRASDLARGNAIVNEIKNVSGI